MATIFKLGLGTILTTATAGDTDMEHEVKKEADAVETADGKDESAGELQKTN